MRMLLNLFMLSIVMGAGIAINIYSQDVSGVALAKTEVTAKTEEVATEEKEKVETPEIAKEEKEEPKEEEKKVDLPETVEKPKETEQAEKQPEAEKTAVEEPKEEQKEVATKVEEKKVETPVVEDVSGVASAKTEEPKPEVKEVEKKAPADQKELPPLEEPLGIDTVQLKEPQGNWLFKRIWWERAEERYEKIRRLVEKIWESRMNFFIKRTEVDKKILDPFYITVGLGQGELKVILSDLMDHMEQEQKEEGMLSEQERALLGTLKTEQEALRQLKLDVESISELDHAIDDALVKLMETINQVREQERDAWVQFKEIARVLSEKKARELFYKMDVTWRNIKSMSAYLEKEFTDHFKDLIGRAEEHIERVKKEIDALKEKGIDFKKQADRMEQQEEQERVQPPPPEVKDEEEEEAVVQKGWIGATVNMITSMVQTTLNAVISVIRWPYDLIFGRGAPEPEAERPE